MLRQCNVVAYVLLDGGYQPKKLNTVRQRLRAKIGAIKYLNPFDAKPMFPIMMREVFIEALEHCGVRFMRCLFEADDEVAALARRLQCPVLSYDSDFYIHNVMYIPSVTLNFRVFRRNIPSSSAKGRQRQRKEMVQQILANGESCKFKTKKVEEDQASAEKVSYYYMDCALYRIKNLVRDQHLRPEMVPLFAVLLGNDYISISLFRKFYSNVSMKRTGKNNSPQGKRIVAILRWLQNETLESAISKIIGHVEKEKKQWLQQQMETAMNGYSQEHSEAYVYFGFASGESTQLTRCYSFSSESTASKDTEEDSGDASEANADSDIALSDHSDTENADENLDIPFVDRSDRFEPPAWLKPKLLSASLPRHIIDMLNLKLYVNSPQVENFLLPDCNMIAIDILRLIFTILHTPNKPELRYLTRVQRRTDIEYKRFDCISDDVHFNSCRPDNFETFKCIFNGLDNAANIIDAVETASMPAELRMFYLAIIYWSKKSEHMNIVHISSLIINYLVLSVIDKRIEPIRSRQKFEKLYRPQEIKQKKPPNIVQSGDEPEPVSSIDGCLEAITRDDCILAQSQLLDLFEVSGKLRAKHTEFSSQILHVFAEFQAIVYQMNCLNALCGEHLAKIRMSDFYNGCFLYNTYVALKERPNVRYYVQHFLFTDSPSMFRLFEAMLAVLAPFVSCISSEAISKRRKKRNINKKKARELRKSQEQAAALVATSMEDDVNGSSSDYDDLNNKFSCLLKV